MATPNVSKSQNGSVNKKVAVAQKYAAMMEDTMKTYFPELYSAPDSLYIMMATMQLESGFRIMHKKGGVSTANHVTIGTGSGIGYSYRNDPLISPKYLDPIGNSTTITILNEGLSAKALMATMGMYQVRGTKESRSIMALGNYLSVAEANGLMVNPGSSCAACFTDDDTGALRSIIMGCIIMEGKYKNRRRKSNPADAIRLAAQDYLGKAGARDILGTSPEMRGNQLASPNGEIAKTLAAAGIVRGAGTTVYGNFPNTRSASQADVRKTDLAALQPSPSTKPVPSNGCTRNSG